MVCQDSTRNLVSSGKRDRALDPGAAEGGGDAFDITTGTVMAIRPMHCLHPLRPIPRSYSAQVLKSSMRGK